MVLNTFSSEISWPISIKFHVDPSVEAGFRVCSNGHAPLTVMPIYSKIIIVIKKNPHILLLQNQELLKLASVAQLDVPSDWRHGGCGFNPHRGWQHSFVEIDHEIFSTVILSHLLIQERRLSVSGERMCAILVNRLED